MKELFIAFGLFLFIEGILYALFPSKMKNMLKKLDLLKDNQLRMGGLIFVILAEAQKKSEIMKGEGDGKRNNIFAAAFGQDPEFFAFYRAMQAYEKALIGGETSLILSPDSEFFKFFGNIKPEIQQ